MKTIETILFNKLVTIDQEALSTFRKKERLLESALELQKLGYSKELEDIMKKIISVNRKIKRNNWFVNFV